MAVPPVPVICCKVSARCLWVIALALTYHLNLHSTALQPTCFVCASSSDMRFSAFSHSKLNLLQRQFKPHPIDTTFAEFQTMWQQFQRHLPWKDATVILGAHTLRSVFGMASLVPESGLRGIKQKVKVTCESSCEALPRARRSSALPSGLKSRTPCLPSTSDFLLPCLSLASALSFLDCKVKKESYTNQQSISYPEKKLTDVTIHYLNPTFLMASKNLHILQEWATAT